MISGGISQTALDSLLEAESKLVEAVAEVQFLLFLILNYDPSLTTSIYNLDLRGVVDRGPPSWWSESWLTISCSLLDRRVDVLHSRFSQPLIRSKITSDRDLKCH